MNKKDNEVENKSKFLKIIILALVLIVAWKFLGKPNPRKVNIIESSAQITSVDTKYSGMGTASKSWNESSFDLNVTAFLDKPKNGLFYYVYLKGNGAELSDLNVGKMVLSGDVYAVNFKSDQNLFAYKDVIVVLQTEADANANKLGKTVLSGSFTK